MFSSVSLIARLMMRANKRTPARILSSNEDEPLTWEMNAKQTNKVYLRLFVVTNSPERKSF